MTVISASRSRAESPAPASQISEGDKQQPKELPSKEANEKKAPHKSDTSSLGASLRFIRNKLVTKHDKGHVHKTLGLGCLINFICRFFLIGPSDMGFSADIFTLFVIAWHAALSLTSMIFHIPMKRLVQGSMIWPEYRLHSIAFAFRSLLCMLLIWVEQHYSVGPYNSVNIAVTFLTLVAAEYASKIAPSGTEMNAGGGTIREVEAPAPVRKFFSILQFHATSGCLICVRRFSTQFMYVWIIQFTAFLFTLRRKNIFPHGILMGTYAFMLVAGFVVATYEDLQAGTFLLHNVMGNMSAFNRLTLRWNKYIVWIVATIFMLAQRQYPEHVDAVLPYLYPCSIGIVLTLFQTRSDSRSKEELVSARTELATKVTLAAS